MKTRFSKKQLEPSGKFAPTRQPKTLNDPPTQMVSLSSNEDEKEGHWRTLPAELALHILSFLSPEDLCRV